MPSRLATLRPASPQQLLVEFLCTPVAMRADRLHALLRELAAPAQIRAGQSPDEYRARRALQPKADDGAGEDDDDHDDWTPPWEQPVYEVEGSTAIVRVYGPLLKGYDAFTCWWYGYFSVDRLQAALHELAARADVSAVIFVFNSPGGVVTGIPETAAQIRALGASKLTVACTDTLACSAAYWLASACSHVFATLSADIGSIGVYLALYDYSAMLKDWGISLDLFKRGKFKAIGVMGSSLTKDQRAFLDADVGRVNDRFLAAVRAHRGTVADDTMQGQWFDGEEALARNLVDQLVTGLPEARREVAVTVAALEGRII